jgi:alpha-amylase
VIESFQELIATGCVELLSETYYHSLASLYCARPEPGSAWPRSQAEPLASAGGALEFRAQVAQHKRLMEELFGVTPRVFCNTELIYDDQIGSELAALGYKGVLAEGADDILDWRSPNYVYRAPGSELGLLLKNYKLSDDVAFRFSNRAWSEFPLSAEKYARWLHALGGEADTINLFMDYETFGEHQWAETGIFGFLQRLPAAVLAEPDFAFHTPSEVLARVTPVAELSFPRTVSWADSERDLSAWTGNDMQTRALARIYALGERIKRRNNPALLSLWRKLTSSDHFYYMCTKWFADGDVHAYFSPYESPYEAFINYMNAVSDLEEFVLGKPAASRAEAVLPAAE